MPHKQKENHDHSSKSKKERQRLRQEQAAKKKAQADARAAAEEEAAKQLNGPNNVALAEGFGAYEIGFEEVEEPVIPRFNANKRSKKHLRQDMRRNAARKEREEQERLQREQEERWQQEQKEEQERRRLENGEEASSSSSEEEEEEEYLIYICECCGKKYATTNQFANHVNSRKHRENAALYEEAGIIVTSVQLQVQLNLEDDDQYQEYEENQYDDFEYGDSASDDDDDDDDYYSEDIYTNAEEVDGETDEEESDEEVEHQQKPKKNIFSALTMLADASSSSSSSEDESDKEEQEELPTPSPRDLPKMEEEEEVEDDDGLDEVEEEKIMLENIIYQNRLIQDEMDAKAENDTVVAPKPTPLPFDDDQYDPDQFTADENRVLSVQHRLQKKLAAKGVESSRLGVGTAAASNAVTMGKTLLQQLMEAHKDTLQAKLEAYNKHKAECRLLNKGFASAKGNSKALPGQYIYRPGAADDTRKRANVHHAGSHYHMQAARSMQYGRSKGLMARHSSQGARLQAKRMAAKEQAKIQSGGGGMKAGKASRKSKQKMSQSEKE